MFLKVKLQRPQKRTKGEVKLKSESGMQKALKYVLSFGAKAVWGILGQRCADKAQG